MAQVTLTHSNVLHFFSKSILACTKHSISLHLFEYNMHIPDNPGLENATEIVNASESRVIEAPDGTERGWRRRRFGKPSALLDISHGTPRTTPAENRQAQGHGERASGCPRGKAFYRCANGFTGCCAHDPCNPGGSCRDGERASPETEKTKTTTHAEKPTSHITTHHPPATHHGITRSDIHTGSRHSQHTSLPHTETSHISSHATSQVTSQVTPQVTPQSTSQVSSQGSSSILSASPTSKSVSTVSPSDTIKPVPSCPAGNGTNYNDSSNIAYNIRCNTDNTYSSDNTTSVGTGGYGECFSACSRANTCAGFTYVGHDSGNCYLKSQMPNGTYVTKEGSNYVSCAKLDPTAASGNSTVIGGKPDSSNTPKKAGIIAGAVIGGVLFLALLLFLIACCAKRHRKKVEKRRATITHVIQGPIETQQLNAVSHQRTGSTSHDVFQPFGGSYYPPLQHTRQRSIYRDQQWV